MLLTRLSKPAPNEFHIKTFLRSVKALHRHLNSSDPHENSTRVWKLFYQRLNMHNMLVRISDDTRQNPGNFWGTKVLLPMPLIEHVPRF